MANDFTWTGSALGPNAHLVGQPGSRARLSTPCLVVDAEALEANIAWMADHCRRSGVALRPHAKTHKSGEIGRMQVAAGAAGLAVATIGEAEALWHGGISDLLITSPLAIEPKIRRLLALAQAGARVATVADHPQAVELLARQAAAAGLRLAVHIDLDVGQRRTGATSPAAAAAIADAILAHPGALALAGLQAYAGHVAHIEDYRRRLDAGRNVQRNVRNVLSALAGRTAAPLAVTGGSTGSLFIDGPGGPFTELQCGSYVFMDTEYAGVDLDGAATPVFRPSLFVRASVISANHEGHVTTDAGFKHFAGPTLPRIHAGPAAGLRYEPTSDEHGRITLDDGHAGLAAGSAVECMVPHCDPTLNLFSHLHAVRGDILTAIWPIEARGAL